MKTRTLSTKLINIVAAMTLPIVLAVAGACAKLHYDGVDGLVNHIYEDDGDGDVVSSALVMQAHERDRARDVATNVCNYRGGRESTS